jgi:5-oxoprolinase (ATP-hydrolysing) subunit A
MPFCLYNRPLTMHLDLNADVGESFGAYSIGHDAGLMRSITSASIAAGFHAGDPSILRETIRLAKAHGVAVGAHPGFPDLVGFGRREMRVTPQEAEDFVLYQVAAVAGVALAGGSRLRHVKPHGALYNMAARDPDLATAIARGVAAIDRSLILYGLPNSELLKAGRAAGLHVAAEGFADRAYAPDGSLAARSRPGSVIHDPALVVARAIRMVKEQLVIAVDGSALTIRVDTVCVHGDTTGADHLAAELRAGLESAGVEVKAIGDPA